MFAGFLDIKKVNYNLEYTSVYHYSINECLMSEYYPHEKLFINYLYKLEIKKNSMSAIMFAMFVLQYYPEYRWTIYPNDLLATVIIECQQADLILSNIFFCSEEEQYDAKTKAIQFGAIVTDFLIRYLGYTLIKCSGEKIIITAQNNCDKQFAEYLDDGFALQRRAKVVFDGEKFYKRPVFPTKDIGRPIDELIETSDNKLTRMF